eukprot:6229240-Amphidinium_carterae.1
MGKPIAGKPIAIKSACFALWPPKRTVGWGYRGDERAICVSVRLHVVAKRVTEVRSGTQHAGLSSMPWCGRCLHDSVGRCLHHGVANKQAQRHYSTTGGSFP